MKREIYKAQKGLTGKIQPINSTAGLQVIKAASSFANSITSLGESLLNINETINTQESIGKAVKSSYYVDMRTSQDMHLAHEAYNTSRLNNTNHRDAAVNLANVIDSTGNLASTISNLSNANQDLWVKNSMTEINRNNADRLKDPGLYAARIAGVTGPDTPERRAAMLKAQEGTSNPVLYTNVEAAAIVEIIQGTDTDLAAATLNQILEDPDRDIVHRQIFETLAGGYKFAGNIADIHKTAFFQGMQMDNDAYNEWYKNTQDSETFKINDIKAAIFSDPDIQDFIQSITGGFYKKDQLLRPQIMDAFQRMTMHFVTQRKTPNEAKAMAIEIITSGFDVVNEDTVKAIFPKSENIDVNSTVKILNNIIKEPVLLERLFENYNIITPSSAMLGDLTGGSERIMKEFVADNGYVVNANATTDGYMIMVDYPERGVIEPLINEDGEIVIMPHEDLDNFIKPKAPVRGYRPGKNVKQREEFYDYYNKDRELSENLKAEKELYKPPSRRGLNK